MSKPLLDYDGTRLYPHRMACLRPTSDNWYPSIWKDDEERTDDGCGGMVRVSISPLNPNFSMWRVACWGNDDFGIDRDFASYDEALQLYLKLCSFAYLTQQNCYDLGMKPF